MNRFFQIMILGFVTSFALKLLAQPIDVQNAQGNEKLAGHTWNHGSEDCSKNGDPAIELYAYSDTTFLLRQNKCTHYEAPFIYVLFGDDTVFVQDTGATADANLFPLYDAIKDLVENRAKQQNRKAESYKWLVTHSHSHSDHIAGDIQFRNKPNVILVEPNLSAVKKAFGFDNEKWPNSEREVDLGGRKLTIIPLPGHKSDAIAVYDEQTQWLLTGDSLYPGRLYIKDWQSYRQSIARLQSFAEIKPISALMGTHIEMTTSLGKDYEMGSTYQPNEAALPMSKRELRLLNDIMQRRAQPERVVVDRFIVYPLD